MGAVIEVLQYILKPGMEITFYSVMENQSVPLHQQCGMRGLRFGNSLHDVDSYYLARTFQNMSDQLKHFYDDLRWKKGPQAAIIEMTNDSHCV
ncbi:NIPSNAP family protein [Photorhabdus sp. RM323S]|uniref:NIPSNAP family protein n=1 Tax=Photorhabdus sp. RM323S TaxID=3342828 RepID=UPI0036DB1A35